MTVSDYMDLAMRMGGISLATYAIVGQVVKPTLRMAAKRHAKKGRLTKAQEGFYSWLTRVMSVGAGCLLGTLPLWPAWLEAAWHPLLGLIAGGMAPAVHHAVAKSLPARIKKILSGGSVTK